MRNRIMIISILCMLVISSACVITDAIFMDSDEFYNKDYEMEDESPLMSADDDELTESADSPDTSNDTTEADDDTGDESATTEEEEPAEPTPIDIILDYSGLTKEQKTEIWLAYWDDPEADWIYSIADIIVNEKMDETDLRILVGIVLALNENAAANYFGNTLFPCDSEIEGGFVVCPEEALPIESGNVLMFVMKLGAEVPPANPDRFYTYAVVLDADGDPANNFQFNPPYNWDYFQNTDRWYMLDWIPDLESWFLHVSDINQQEQILSGARAVVMGDTITFFIPANEFAVEYPAYRLTAFGHDGTYSPEASCGDISGANPTEPLRSLPENILPIE